MNKTLKYVVLGGIFLIPFIPFIVANDFFFPFITGKNFAFRILVEIIFASWVAWALVDTSVRPRGSALVYAFVAFILSLGVSTLLAENTNKALWSNFERMEGYVTIVHLGAYFLVLTSVLNVEKLWKAFWNTSIGVSIALSLFGIGQIAGFFVINQGGVRLDATFGNATYLAVYMLFHAFITIYALAKWKPSRWVQIVYGIALVLQFSMVFYTATRGTILGLLGGLFVSGLVFALFSKNTPQLRKAGIGLIAALVIVVGAFLPLRDAPFVTESPVLSRLASINLEEGSTRFSIWNMAWKGFLEKPVFGWGQENFNYVFNTHYDASLYAQEPWFDRAHNVFFDWLVAGGALGLLLYVSFYAITLWYLWRKENGFDISERALFTGLLAGYAFHNLFVFDNLMSYVLFFAVLGYIHQRHTKNVVPFGGEKMISPWYAKTVAGVMAVLLIVVVYSVNVPGMVRAAGLIDSIRPYQEGLAKNFEEFKGVVTDSGVGRQEVHEQLLQFALQIRDQSFADRVTDELKTEVGQFAVNEFSKEIERNPNDTRLRLFFGSFLRQVGAHTQADEMLLAAHMLSPEKQSVLFELGALQLDKGDTLGALAYFKQAYELEPRYDRARSLYVAVAIRAGESEIADALLIERYDTVTPNDDIVLQAYVDVGNNQRVVQIAENKVLADPENFQTHLQLAAAYLEVGRRADAVEALGEAIKRNPDFKTQGEYFISEIQAGRNP